ncbi:MAG: hypothetical protein ACP5JF_03580 [Candidatus Methanodesulfokora sp.]
MGSFNRYAFAGILVFLIAVGALKLVDPAPLSTSVGKLVDPAPLSTSVG